MNNFQYLVTSCSKVLGSPATPKFVSVSKSPVTDGWMVVSAVEFLSARCQLLQWRSTEGMQCNRTVHLGSQCSHSDLVSRRPGVWACTFGNVVLAAACVGCEHARGAAAGLPALEASDVGMSACEGAQCWVVPFHSKSGHISHCIPAWFMHWFGTI